MELGKKLLVIGTLFYISINFIFAQSTQIYQGNDPTGIYYNLDKIGIGTTNPFSSLDIQAGSVAWGQGISIRENGGYSAVFFPHESYPNAATKRLFVGRDQSSSNDYFTIHRNGYSGNLYSSYALLSINLLDGTTAFDGNVGIGTTNPGEYKLAVNGKIKTKEVKVTLEGWSDFVFRDDYKLKTIEEVEIYIQKYQHLPDIPSEKQVINEGIELGIMQSRLLQKIEEQMLYIIKQNKRIKKLEKENKKIEKLEKLVNELMTKR